MSSDPIDAACIQEQRDRDLCIAVARQQASKREIPAMGICHNCHTPVSLGERWCDKFCAADFDDRVRAAKRNGRPMV